MTDRKQLATLQGNKYRVALQNVLENIATELKATLPNQVRAIQFNWPNDNVAVYARIGTGHDLEKMDVTSLVSDNDLNWLSENAIVLTALKVSPHVFYYDRMTPH